jgi:hypothetical protein
MNKDEAKNSKVRSLLAAALEDEDLHRFTEEVRRMVRDELVGRGFSDKELEHFVLLLSCEPAKIVGSATLKAAEIYKSLQALESHPSPRTAVIVCLRLIDLLNSTRQQKSTSGDAWYPKAKHIYWRLMESTGKATSASVHKALKEQGYSPKGTLDNFKPQFSVWKKRFELDLLH